MIICFDVFWKPFQLMTQLNILDHAPLEAYGITAGTITKCSRSNGDCCSRRSLLVGYKEGGGVRLDDPGAMAVRSSVLTEPSGDDGLTVDACIRF